MGARRDALPSAFVHYLGHTDTCQRLATVSFAWGSAREHIATLTAKGLLAQQVSHTSLHSTGTMLHPSSTGICLAIGPSLAPAVGIMLALLSQAASVGAIRATCHARPRLPRLHGCQCLQPATSGHSPRRYRHRNPSKNGATLVRAHRPVNSQPHR